MATGLPATTPAEELVTQMVGRKLEQLFPERPSDQRGGARRSRRCALPDVKSATSPAACRGGGAGIAGLVGAGRSERLRAVYGVDRRDAGEVTVDGRRFTGPGSTWRSKPGWPAPEDRKSQALLLEWDLTRITLPPR